MTLRNHLGLVFIEACCGEQFIKPLFAHFSFALYNYMHEEVRETYLVDLTKSVLFGKGSA